MLTDFGDFCLKLAVVFRVVLLSFFFRVPGNPEERLVVDFGVEEEEEAEEEDKDKELLELPLLQLFLVESLSLSSVPSYSVTHSADSSSLRCDNCSCCCCES